jgi:hypothetical protein
MTSRDPNSLFATGATAKAPIIVDVINAEEKPKTQPR